MPKNNKSTGKKSAPVKVKSRRISVPANAKVFIVKPGEPYPDELRTIIDWTVKNELEVLKEIAAEAERNAATNSRPITTQECFEKVAGYILGAPFNVQTAVMAKLFENVKRARTNYLFDVTRQHEHISEQRDMAQQLIYDLQNIQNGSAIIIE